MFKDVWAEDWSPSHTDFNVIRASNVGDVVHLADGHNYKLIKKTTTAASLERYYWWDKLYDKYVRKPDAV
jgi:hypothetical protein